MVDIVIKVTKPEVEVTTATDLDEAVLFRVFTPSGSGDAVITIRNSLGGLIGSMTQPAGFVEIMNKNPTDTVEATAIIKCVPVAWK